ncbi:MAG: heavy-metal-associated domain-containing protein [Bacilli bacterium]
MVKTITIEGMSCQHCVKRVEKALNALKGVEAKVSLENKQAIVNIKEDVSNQLLTNIISELGYRVISIK